MFINSNYSRGQHLPNDGSDSWSLFSRMRAAVAAPTYFPAYEHSDGKTFFDAAIVTNNPTMIALQEAQSLWPARPIGTIVSLGCGRVIDATAQTPKTGLTYWAGQMLSMPMGVYKTHREVKHVVPTLNRHLGHDIPPPTYFRLDPPQREYALDESRPRALEKMRARTQEYILDRAHLMKVLAATVCHLGQEGLGDGQLLREMPTFETSDLELAAILEEHGGGAHTSDLPFGERRVRASVRATVRVGRPDPTTIATKAISVRTSLRQESSHVPSFTPPPARYVGVCDTSASRAQEIVQRLCRSEF